MADVLPIWRAMPLIRAPQAFDHPDWIFELKHDGFRALAVVDHYRATLVTRRGHEFKQWPQLSEEFAHAIRARRPVLAGELATVDATDVAYVAEAQELFLIVTRRPRRFTMD